MEGPYVIPCPGHNWLYLQHHEFMLSLGGVMI